MIATPRFSDRIGYYVMLLTLSACTCAAEAAHSIESILPRTQMTELECRETVLSPQYVWDELMTKRPHFCFGTFRAEPARPR